MISVVIVTKYERWDDLDNCLSALAKQKFQDFEIIIVVPKNVNPQIQDLSPTKWITHVISQGGVGISNARNCGVKAAKGEVIAFTDDDAEPHRDWVEKIKQHFDQQPELDYLGGEFTLEPKNIWQRWILKRYHLSPTAIEAGLCHGNNMAYKRAVFDTFQFDENLLFGADESEFQTRLKAAGLLGTTFQDLLIRHQHRNSFLSFSKMRWGYGQGHSYLYEVKYRQALFHWNDLLNVAFFISFLYAALLTLRGVVWFWLFPTFFFVVTASHEKQSDATMTVWLIDVYVSMLWTLSKMYHSLKYHLKRWGWIR